MKGVSVILCCYNSATRLPETLMFLKDQRIPADLPWEVVLVDNASTDNTVEIARNTWGEHFAPLRVISELKPGQAYARQTGIASAAYDYILFVDDDNHLEPDYVSVAFDIMRIHPEVAIAGGVAKPKFDKHPGKWIEANYGALAIGDHGPVERYVSWVFGAGMIVRKSLYEELNRRGIKFILSGRIGKKQTSGDDAEICQLAVFLGYRIYYSPAMVLHHKIAQHRLTKRFFIKANYKNVFMMVYFFILESLMKERDSNEPNIYKRFFSKCVKNTFYFLPRAVLGKNAFFSFMMLFQNAQLVMWLMLRRTEFRNTYGVVKRNLYNGNSGE